MRILCKVVKLVHSFKIDILYVFVAVGSPLRRYPLPGDRCKVSNRWAGSFVASFADISGMDSVGWGFVIHSPIRNISMGIIRRGGINGSQIGVFTNIDLTKLFTQYLKMRTSKTFCVRKHRIDRMSGFGGSVLIGFS